MKILVRFVFIHSFQTKKVDKFKVQLPDSRISQESDVILFTPVVDVVHTASSMSGNQKYFTFIHGGMD